MKLNKINKVLNFEIKQIGLEEDRVLRFVGSDETPDRDSDIIEVSGWKLDEYLKNPVFLWAHQHDQPPVGKAVNVTIDAVSKKLLFDIKFPTADEYPFADTIYKLYKGGYLNATSVGFQGVKYKTRDDDAVIDKPEWQRGRRYMEQKLLELSAVPVPSNPNALQTIRSKGFEDEDIDKIFEEEKSVIPYKSYPTEPEGTEWDGPAEIAAADVDDLKIMCAWYDSENPDVKQSYKLPHHRASDKHLIWRGVTAAMGALLGARGGVQIPENDRRGVYNHLARHYKDNFDKEPPEFKEYTDMELKTIFEHEEKSGATISAKNRAMLNEICEGLKGCGDRLRKFIDTSGMMEDEPPDDMPMMPMMEPMISAMRTIIAQEIKSAIENFQVLLLSQKSNKEINLDDIEFPKTEKDAAQDEPEIEPEELKKLIQEIISNELKGGM